MSGDDDRPEREHPIQLRWARERGWIAVRDPATGQWHEIQYKDAPESWKDALRRPRAKTPR